MFETSILVLFYDPVTVYRICNRVVALGVECFHAAYIYSLFRFRNLIQLYLYGCSKQQKKTAVSRAVEEYKCTLIKRRQERKEYNILCYIKTSILIMIVNETVV